MIYFLFSIKSLGKITVLEFLISDLTEFYARLSRRGQMADSRSRRSVGGVGNRGGRIHKKAHLNGVGRAFAPSASDPTLGEKIVQRIQPGQKSRIPERLFFSKDLMGK